MNHMCNSLVHKTMRKKILSDMKNNKAHGAWWQTTGAKECSIRRKDCEQSNDAKNNAGYGEIISCTVFGILG